LPYRLHPVSLHTSTMARNQLGLTKTEDHLSKLAYALGTLQALTWSVLSTICLVLYLEPSRFPQVDSHMDQISYLIYGFFLARETHKKVFGDFVLCL
jgi:hypothetical protein